MAQFLSGDDDDLSGGDYTSGDDDETGAARRGGKRASLPASRGDVSANRVKAFVGLGVYQWTNTIGAIAHQFVVEPQREFTPTRVVIIEEKSATGEGGVLLVTDISCNGIPQSPAPGSPAPARMFSDVVTESGVVFQTVGKACQFVVTLQPSSAPSMGETVDASVGAYGWSVMGSSK